MSSRYAPARIARAIGRRARWKIAEEYAAAKARCAAILPLNLGETKGTSFYRLFTRDPCAQPGLPVVGYVAETPEAPPADAGVRLIAFYLPDAGALAKQKFPLLAPDFRRGIAEALADHVRVARACGIAAFCFDVGVRAECSAETEFVDVFLTIAPREMGFCLRLRQRASGCIERTEVDARAIERVAAYTRDFRYISVRGKPLVMLQGSWSRTGKQQLRESLRQLASSEIHIVEDRGAADHRGPGHRRAHSPTAAFSAPYPVVSADRNVEASGAIGSLHACPRRYEERLLDGIRAARASEGIVFIDSWNDWKRGAVLEPDTRFGHAYLAATRRGVERVTSPVQAASRLCIVVHAFYPELLKEMMSFMCDVPASTRVVVTTVAEREEAIRNVLSQLPLPFQVQVHENRGRDVLPFLRVANDLANEGETLVLKLHTKRSQHREDGDAWRKELLEEMLSKRSLERILRAFDEEPKLGIVGPSGHMLSTKTYFGYNESRVRYITRRMGFRELDPGATPFPAGSMYFARMDALRPLLDAHFKECEFEAESGAVDGTMAHAVERSIGVSCIGSGHFLSASSEPRVRIEHGSQTYRFAIAFRA